MPYDRGYDPQNQQYRYWTNRTDGDPEEESGPWVKDGMGVRNDDGSVDVDGRFVKPRHIGMAQDNFAANEVGLVHPNRNSFIRIRDNGDIEIVATDGCSITLSSVQRAAIINADEVKLLTKTGGLFWNKAQFNDNSFRFTEPALISNDFDNNNFVLGQTKIQFTQKRDDSIAKRESLDRDFSDDHTSSNAVVSTVEQRGRQKYAAQNDQPSNVVSNTGVSNATAQINEVFAVKVKVLLPAISTSILVTTNLVVVKIKVIQVIIRAVETPPLEVYVNYNGQSNCGYSLPNSAKKSLTWGYGTSSYNYITATSYMTIWIDGSHYINRRYGSNVFITSSNWVTENINQTTFTDDLLQVEVNQVIEIINSEAFYNWTIRNTDSVNHEIGFRAMFDAQVWDFDEAYYLINNVLENVGRIFTPPLSQFIFATPYWPNVTVSGFARVLGFAGARTPTSLVIYSWGDLHDNPWYPTNDYGYENYDDSAWAIFWDPIQLAPGESFTCKTSIGIFET